MKEEPLRNLAGQLPALGGEDLRVQPGLADGFGIVGASILDVTRVETTVRVWNAGDGDFWFQLGDEQQAAWWRQDGKRTPLPKVIMALVEGAYVIRKARVTMTIDGKSVVLRESI
jgi:hypothetical protein